MKDLSVGKRGGFFTAATILIAVFLLVGCQTILPGEPLEKAVITEDEGIILKPGDVIDIKFFHVAELNETQTVRPDGKISLQSVGEIVAEGKTPANLRQEIVGHYSKLIKQPELTVIVRSLHDRVVYVSGEVTTPGRVDLLGRLTALEAIMRAGGFKSDTAMLYKIVIIRHKDGKRHRYVLDLRGVFSGTKVQKPFYLQPNDIIYVPRF